jgi:hypothetical protein
MKGRTVPSESSTFLPPVDIPSRPAPNVLAVRSAGNGCCAGLRYSAGLSRDAAK